MYSYSVRTYRYLMDVLSDFRIIMPHGSTIRFQLNSEYIFVERYNNVINNRDSWLATRSEGRHDDDYDTIWNDHANYDAFMRTRALQAATHPTTTNEANEDYIVIASLGYSIRTTLIIQRNRSRSIYQISTQSVFIYREQGGLDEVSCTESP